MLVRIKNISDIKRSISSLNHLFLPNDIQDYTDIYGQKKNNMFNDEQFVAELLSGSIWETSIDGIDYIGHQFVQFLVPTSAAIDENGIVDVSVKKHDTGMQYKVEGISDTIITDETDCICIWSGQITSGFLDRVQGGAIEIYNNEPGKVAYVSFRITDHDDIIGIAPDFLIREYISRIPIYNGTYIFDSGQMSNTIWPGLYHKIVIEKPWSGELHLGGWVIHHLP